MNYCLENEIKLKVKIDLKNDQFDVWFLAAVVLKSLLFTSLAHKNVEENSLDTSKWAIKIELLCYNNNNNNNKKQTRQAVEEKNYICIRF